MITTNYNYSSIITAETFCYTVKLYQKNVC